MVITKWGIKMAERKIYVPSYDPVVIAQQRAGSMVMLSTDM
jgi:hypothetical protein